MLCTHTHPFNGPVSGTTRVSRYQKGKPIWILLKEETVSGSGISWAICKSAHRSRQITMPAPHLSVFYRRMPFLPPNQQCRSTEGTNYAVQYKKIQKSSWNVSCNTLWQKYVEMRINSYIPGLKRNVVTQFGKKVQRWGTKHAEIFHCCRFGSVCLRQGRGFLCFAGRCHIGHCTSVCGCSVNVGSS